MNRWLALVCALGCLGGAFTTYTAISVGSSGLLTLSTAMQQLATVLTTYNNTLNTARTQIFVGLTDLMGWVNITYTALNKTYGANQTSLPSFLQSLSYFNQTIQSGDQSATMSITMDLNQLRSIFTQAFSNVLQYYNMLQSSMSMVQIALADNCTARNATQMINVPTSLAKFGQCIQINTATVLAYVPTLVNIISVAKNDFVSLNNQLKLCASASSNCQNYYFQQLYSEQSTGMSMLYLLIQVIMSGYSDASSRDQFCASLVEYDLQDTLTNLQNAYQSCIWPPS
ncbi:uncharacterized protein LOC131436506 [Malaya genurostris]|uniref:uncharacterized protein LOC131436506 n=1 Tax=Malaya genurostris TaxID=325434 RepID=UPI0026F3F112|nr:uncharacterized protein LOC131436506 [Malaya genurostris]